MIAPATFQRFWNQIEKTDSCWLWRGYLRNGYHGAIWLNGRMFYVHRLSYLLHIGLIPPGQMVCHRCDVPNCVNPTHLFLGTQRDNFEDMRNKNRQKNPPLHRGETHPLATLTNEQVRALRPMACSGCFTQRELAKRFNVSQSTIWRIAHGMTRTLTEVLA